MLERQKRDKISQLNKHALSVAYPIKTKFWDCPHPRAPRLLSFPREPLSLDSLKYYSSPNQTGHSPPHPGGEGVMTVTPCSFSSRQPKHTTSRHVTSSECAPIRVHPPTVTDKDKDYFKWIYIYAKKSFQNWSIVIIVACMDWSD